MPVCYLTHECTDSMVSGGCVSFFHLFRCTGVCVVAVITIANMWIRPQPFRKSSQSRIANWESLTKMSTAPKLSAVLTTGCYIDLQGVTQTQWTDKYIFVIKLATKMSQSRSANHGSAQTQTQTDLPYSLFCTSVHLGGIIAVAVCKPWISTGPKCIIICVK